MKINILGAEYDFIETTDTDDPRLVHVDGVHLRYTKEILIEKNVLRHDSGDDIQTVRSERIKQVKRHELIHAFFLQSGLEEYSNNEQLVSWLAIQLPKIIQAIKEVGG